MTLLRGVGGGAPDATAASTASSGMWPPYRCQFFAVKVRRKPLDISGLIDMRLAVASSGFLESSTSSLGPRFRSGTGGRAGFFTSAARGSSGRSSGRGPRGSKDGRFEMATLMPVLMCLPLTTQQTATPIATAAQTATAIASVVDGPSAFFDELPAADVGAAVAASPTVTPAKVAETPASAAAAASASSKAPEFTDESTACLASPASTTSAKSTMS
mmetsp:Transcript_4403/g.14769  ORF Transcript_4403/g.14769 Transcript_4403/m.14769 type:complete len:216 (-) Transcript_4403:37-684(-)